MARVFLARTLWLQGDADQAARIALNSAEEAGTANHANTLGYVLGLGTCLIALWRGDQIWLTVTSGCSLTIRRDMGCPSGSPLADVTMVSSSSGVAMSRRGCKCFAPA